MFLVQFVFMFSVVAPNYFYVEYYTLKCTVIIGMANQAIQLILLYILSRLHHRSETSGLN